MIGASLAKPANTCQILRVLGLELQLVPIL